MWALYGSNADSVAWEERLKEGRGAPWTPWTNREQMIVPHLDCRFLQRGILQHVVFRNHALFLMQGPPHNRSFNPRFPVDSIIKRSLLFLIVDLSPLFVKGPHEPWRRCRIHSYVLQPGDTFTMMMRKMDVGPQKRLPKKSTRCRSSGLLA